MKRILTAVALTQCVASASHADDRFTFEKYPASAVSNKAIAKLIGRVTTLYKGSGVSKSQLKVL